MVAALMAIAGAWADADEVGAPMFSLGGFGTLGAVHSSEHRADFTTSGFNANGAGFTRDWSASVDSLIAAQVTANFTPRLSAVLQVISQQNHDNTYWPHVEWADIKYQFTSDFSLRVGRTVLPSFLVSDARAIGYSNPWVRPPVEVYGLIPISNSDGVDASYLAHIGHAVHRVTATYGSTNRKIPMHGSADARQIWLVSDTMEWGAATLHIAYQHTRLTVDYLNALFDAFRAFGPQGNILADRYGTKDKIATFFGFGVVYDPGKWFATAEWGTTELNSVLGKSTGWYASSGYRLAAFTPYLTYAQSSADNLSDAGLPCRRCLPRWPDPQALSTPRSMRY